MVRIIGRDYDITVTEKRENPRAEAELGQQYFYGEGKKKSYKNAFPYLLEAAKAGEAHCQNLVGNSYQLGLGVQKNVRLSLLWYKRAANSNDKEGLFNQLLTEVNRSCTFVGLDPTCE